ncbi:ZINC INDUCED FACILITATOR-LIKE 1-like protein [Drosera capensis]
MIRDFHVAPADEDIGYYAGFVGAAYMLGRALTSVCWGMLADKYGRKPIIITGAIIVVIFNTLFGFSVNLWMDISTRFLLGSLNGIIGPIYAYACESVPYEYQALGLSTVSSAWSIALIMGPAVGGFLAQPTEKYPSLFSKGSIFGRFPYLLPCLCISAFALPVAIGSFWLPETLHIHNETKSVEDTSSPKALKGATSEAPSKSLIKNWPLLSAIIVYCIFSLHDMAYSEIFSLWAVSPRKLGGLSYTTDRVGIVLSITGVGMLIFQLFIYPHVQKLLGPILLVRISGVLSIPLLQSYPLIALLSGLSLTLVINFASIAKNSMTMAAITSLLLMQSRAVDQDQRGTANGIAVTSMSLFKAIGPVIGGALLSWAEKRRHARFLPGSMMMFFLLNVVELAAVLLTFKPFLVERLA